MIIVDIRALNNAALGARICAAMRATDKPIPWWLTALRVVVEVVR